MFAETSASPNSAFLCAFWPLILFLNDEGLEIWINTLRAEKSSQSLLELTLQYSQYLITLLACWFSKCVETTFFLFEQEKEAFIASQLKAKGLTTRDDQGDDMYSEHIEQ